MTSNIAPSKVQRQTFTIRLAFLVAAGVMLALGALLVNASIEAPAARSYIKLQDAQEIAQENHFFCKKFGLSPNTTAFGVCTGDLTQIRKRQEERWRRELDIL